MAMSDAGHQPRTDDTTTGTTFAGVHRNESVCRRVMLMRTATTGAWVTLGPGVLTACDAIRRSSWLPPAPGVALIALNALTAGRSVVLTPAASEPVLVLRSGADTASAHSAICTHQGCTVQASGGQAQCPCHGSLFDARTGQVIQGPAPTPLPTVAVRLLHGQVVTA